MSTMTLTAGTVRHHGVSSSVAAFFADFCAGARDGREIQARCNVLARMSAAELGSLGLTRADIGRAAVTGRLR